MIYCPQCHKAYEDGTKECPECHKELQANISADEKTSLVQALHKKETKYRDFNDKAMSALVLGVIFLIIGVIFFNLSYKLDLNNQSDTTRYLRTDVFEFYVAVICLGGGGLATLYGLIRLVIDARILRVTTHDIREINRSKTAVVSKTGLWISEATSNLKTLIYNHKAIREAERSKKNKQ
jgi:hypothetical protein